MKSALEAVGKVTSENPNLPVLKNILLKAENGRLQATATNLEVAVTMRVAGKIIEDGEVTIPFGTLNAVVQNLQSERINLDGRKNNILLTTDNYEATLQGTEAGEFPIIPQVSKKNPPICISGSLLKEALNKVRSAAQVSDLRPEISGVLILSEEKSVRFVATDSFRLAEKTLSSSQFTSLPETPLRALVPLKTVDEILRIIGDSEEVSIYLDETQLLLATETTEIVSRLIEGTFPDYRAIIPSSFDKEVTLDKSELMGALKLASVFTARTHEITIKLHDDKRTVEIISSDASLGENKYLISGTLKGQGGSVAFNWKFLFDGLRNLSGESAFFGVNTETRKVVLKNPSDETYLYILMINVY